MRVPIKITAIIIALLFPPLLFAQSVRNFFISPSGSDDNPGILQRPFATISKARSMVREIKKTKGLKEVNILFRKGTYETSKAILFTPADGGDSLLQIKYSAYRHEKVVISGGKRLQNHWKKTADANVWKLQIAEAKDGWVFRSLFANNKRLQRATSDTLFTKGPFLQYAQSFRTRNFASIKKLVRDSLDAFCGFTYANSDLDKLAGCAGAELILYNSWEASWHAILKIDTGQKAVYLKNPSTYPVGFFSNRLRYRVENSRHYFDKAGEWYLDSKAGDLYYRAFANEDPNRMQFVVPVVDNLLLLQGEEKGGKPVENIAFSEIDFAFTASPWGINDAPASVREKSVIKFPWIDFNEGYSSGQAALDCGASVLLLNSKHVVFDKCGFYHLGNYAIHIGDFASNNTINKSTITDAGGGGIIIGINKPGGLDKNLPDNISPAYNTVSNCTITNCGIIFPSTVAIGIMQAGHTTIRGNTISDLPYSGISVGWTWGYQDNYTSYNLIEENNLHDVVKVLADGAGIYTLGKQAHTVYRGNYIHDIGRSKNAAGATNNGFFFDEGSSGFEVNSNAVTGIQNEDVRFNGTDSFRINFVNNYFEKTGANKDVLNRLRVKFINKSISH